jgi:putative endonuclease
VQNLQAKNKGRKGEQLAAKHLQNNGYKILELNWHKRWAEIDIVALDGDTLAFIEVKTRYSKERGLPEESITPQKLSSLVRSAQLYAQEHPKLPEALRIDFVGIDYTNGNPPRINVIKNISG